MDNQNIKKQIYRKLCEELKAFANIKIEIFQALLPNFPAYYERFNILAGIFKSEKINASAPLIDKYLETFQKLKYVPQEKLQKFSDDETIQYYLKFCQQIHYEFSLSQLKSKFLDSNYLFYGIDPENPFHSFGDAGESSSDALDTLSVNDEQIIALSDPDTESLYAVNKILDWINDDQISANDIAITYNFDSGYSTYLFKYCQMAKINTSLPNPINQEFDLNLELEKIWEHFEVKSWSHLYQIIVDLYPKYRYILNILLNINPEYYELTKENGLDFIELILSKYQDKSTDNYSEVTIAPISKLKNCTFKKLLVLGMVETVAPVTHKEDSLLREDMIEKIADPALLTLPQEVSWQKLELEDLIKNNPDYLITYPKFDIAGKDLVPSRWLPTNQTHNQKEAISYQALISAQDKNNQTTYLLNEHFIRNDKTEFLPQKISKKYQGQVNADLIKHWMELNPEALTYQNYKLYLKDPMKFFLEFILGLETYNYNYDSDDDPKFEFEIKDVDRYIIKTLPETFKEPEQVINYLEDFFAKKSIRYKYQDSKVLNPYDPQNQKDFENKFQGKFDLVVKDLKERFSEISVDEENHIWLDSDRQNILELALDKFKKPTPKDDGWKYFFYLDCLNAQELSHYNIENLELNSIFLEEVSNIDFDPINLKHSVARFVTQGIMGYKAEAYPGYLNKIFPTFEKRKALSNQTKWKYKKSASENGVNSKSLKILQDGKER